MDRLFGIVMDGLAHNTDEDETMDDVVEDLHNQDSFEAAEVREPRAKKGASVKISTIKHLVVMLASPPSGLGIAAICSRFTTLFETTSHHSVQLTLLQTFIDLLIRDGPIIAAPYVDVIFGQLERMGLGACGLDGKTSLSEDWPQEKLPAIDTDNTAVNSVLSILRTQIPASFASRYVTVVEKMYATQAKNSKRWMVEYMQRNGASEADLKTMEGYSFGPLLNLRGHLGNLVKTWRKEIPHHSTLIRLIHDLPTTFLHANSLRSYLERLRTKSTQLAEEQSAQDFKRLVGIWDERDEHLRILVDCLSLFGNQEDLDALKDIFSTLLLSANQSVMRGGLSNPGRATPHDLLLTLIDHLQPQNIRTPIEKDAWLKHVRPLAAWLREKVKEDQSTGIPGTRLNIGAAYTRVLVKLEVSKGY